MQAAEHTDRGPLTTDELAGVGCVSRAYTDYATFDIKPGGVHVVATYGISLAELRDRVNVKLAG
jgi:3-oxoadipate CoA-transferase beta subunit